MNKPAIALFLLCLAARTAPAQQLINAPAFQGQAQSDLNLGGHNLTNAGTVTATALSGPLPWSSLTGKPTTLSGYGITDPILLSTGTYANPAWLTSLATSKLTGTLPWSSLTGTPTSLSGYGIADPILLSTGTYANPAWLTSLATSKLTGTLPWSSLTGTPTSLSGYGIADPVVKTSGSYADPAWITSLSAAKLSGALPAISGASLTALPGANLATNSVPNIALAQAAALTVKGNSTGATANVGDLSMTTLKTMLALAFTNISGTLTKAQQYSTTAYTDALNTFVGVQTVTSTAGDTMHAGITVNTSADGYPELRYSNAGTQYYEFGMQGGTTNMFAIYDDIVHGSVLSVTSYSDTAGGHFGFNLGGTGKASEVIEAAGNIKGNHFVGRTSAPAATSWGTGAGTSPSASSVAGNDAAMTISFTTGTSPAANAAILTITFNSGYGAAPRAVLMGADAASQALIGTVYATTTSTTLTLNSGATALTASHAFNFVVHILQ
jgi:hypothetical protein